MLATGLRDAGDLRGTSAARAEVVGRERPAIDEDFLGVLEPEAAGAERAAHPAHRLGVFGRLHADRGGNEAAITRAARTRDRPRAEQAGEISSYLPTAQRLGVV